MNLLCFLYIMLSVCAMRWQRSRNTGLNAWADFIVWSWLKHLSPYMPLLFFCLLLYFIFLNYENTITHLQEIWKIQSKVTYSSTIYVDVLLPWVGQIGEATCGLSSGQLISQHQLPLMSVSHFAHSTQLAPADIWLEPRERPACELPSHELLNKMIWWF